MSSVKLCSIVCFIWKLISHDLIFFICTNRIFNIQKSMLPIVLCNVSDYAPYDMTDYDKTVF